MIVFALPFFVVSSFSDFFGTENPTVYTGFNPLISFGVGAFYLQRCLFNELSSKAILFQNEQSVSFMMEQVSLIKCNSNTLGGALDFQSSNGASVLNKVCGFGCSASGANANFGHIKAGNAKMSKILMTSISKCTPSSHIGFFSLALNSGIETINHMNSSNHFCNSYTGFYCYQSRGMNFSFSTLSSNKASADMCIGYHFATEKGNVEYCNIINNNSPGASYAVIYNGGSSNDFNHCCFLNNQNILLTIVSSGVVKVFNCYIIHDAASISSGGGFTFINITYQTFILTHYYYASNECEAEITLEQEPTITLHPPSYITRESYYLILLINV